MGFVERLVELKNYSKSPSPDRQSLHNSPSVSFVMCETGAFEKCSPALDAYGYPAQLCQTCGGGNYYMAQGWHCSRCYPSEELPRRTYTIPGGTVAQGEQQNVERVLHEAITGTPVKVETLRKALDEADLEDVRWGRITVRTLRALVTTLDVRPDCLSESVRCINCTHFQRRDYHPHLGSCSAGVPPSCLLGDDR